MMTAAANEKFECYICLTDACGEFMNCSCRAPVHRKCYADYYRASGQTACTICKTTPVDLVAVHVRSEIKTRFSWQGYIFGYVIFFLAMSTVISYDPQHIRMQHRDYLAYMIVALFSFPMGMLCAIKKSGEYVVENVLGDRYDEHVDV